MKDWTSIAGFLARYLGIDPLDMRAQCRCWEDTAMGLAMVVVEDEPELAPYVLQVILEGD